jgi:hypothetical protein
MLNRCVATISAVAILLTGGFANAQERLVSVNGTNNVFVDSKDIFIQDHVAPDIRVARVATVNNSSEISNVIVTFVNCRTNASGIMMIANGRGEIVHMEQGNIQLIKQEPGTQAYEIIRTICRLPARSGSVR